MNKLEHIPNVDELLAFDLNEIDPPVRDVWTELSEGSIGADEAIARAREIHPDLDEDDLKQRARAFAPPSPEVFANELKLVLAAHSEDLDPSPGSRPSDEQADPQRAAAPTPPIPLRRSSSRLRTTGTAAAGLAAAAALVLSLVPDEPDDTDRSDASSTAPSSTEAVRFQAEWTPWKGPLLGPSDHEPSAEPIRIKDRVVLKLRPMTTIPANTDLAIKGWARTDDETHALTLHATRGTLGSFDIKQSTETLGLTPGDWTVTLVVGPPEVLETILDLDDLGPDERPGLWIHRAQLRVVK